MIELRTQRLTLRQLIETDRDFFFQLNRLPAVMRHIDPARSDAVIERKFQQRMPSWTPEVEHWLALAVIERTSGRPIGLHGFKLASPPLGPAELGYMFLPDSQGQGFAQEATGAVLDFAFDICGLHKATATVTAGNHASEKLLQRMGFRLEGRLRAEYRMDGAWHDDLKYGLLATDRC
ncbi:GNAT family N-acetyltransferase [Paludibacterium purpuratum]|uniref:RimJ/RimL family protein N-acetyltransferase n=1 Tax=Paludibacterium purpuratum TaxID=1144873 RepID=A0A4R7B7K4_9NEIS|nr:GNAT family N-acetyltransferase [Paludibacterium purpuratum]TDR80698.1 RimJ/RimL family protein N-acetyltransferase [Paludibacterium purpuratum]